MRAPVTLLIALLAAGGAAASEAPPLVDAARNTDTAALRALLGGGAPAGAADVDGTTALHWASYRDDLESAGLLLEAGADVNAATDLGVTPLWLAAENASPVMVRRLLEAGADANQSLLLGETPAMVAARAGNADVLELLLAAGADPEAPGARGQTALMWAAAGNRTAAVEVLLAHGADVHARSDVWSQVMAVPPHGRPEYNGDIPHGGNTALMFAVREGALAAAQRLVAAGGDVDDADAWGVSAVVLAAHAGHLEVVEFLLAEGADPSADVAGFSALHPAVMRRDARLVAALLAHGADPNARLRTWTPTRRASRDFHFRPALVGATPFWLAARLGEPGIMRLLAEHGADTRFVHHADYVPSRRGIRRQEATTALMAALGMGGGRRLRAWIPDDGGEPEVQALATVMTAVELGVDVNAADLDGRTALDAATDWAYETVIEFLVERGAKSGGL